MADSFDFDGEVESVRFYGNGEDLGLQTRKVLDSIRLTSPGNGYTSPPDILLEGGGGTGATAVSALEAPQRNQQGQPQNNPRGVATIAIGAPGDGYFKAPNVIITGGGGAGARATARLTEKTEETLAEELIPGAGRWGLEWVPQIPGTYLVSLEVTDDDGDVTVVPANAEIVVTKVGFENT
jgi:hypothetical protein